jgi:hypothetical protein
MSINKVFEKHYITVSNCDYSTYVLPGTNAVLHKFSAYVLADHVDNQSVDYEVLHFPKWLKWLKRFCRVEKRNICIDAFWTYPQAKVKLPDLGVAKKFVTSAQRAPS